MSQHRIKHLYKIVLCCTMAWVDFNWLHSSLIMVWWIADVTGISWNILVKRHLPASFTLNTEIHSSNGIILKFHTADTVVSLIFTNTECKFSRNILKITTGFMNFANVWFSKIRMMYSVKLIWIICIRFLMDGSDWII